MSKVPYEKRPLTYEEQLKLLKERGLQISNDNKVIHLLTEISYYRLSGYWFPLLQDKKKHIFKEGSTFESAFNLYKFDRELRFLITREIEKIEVAIRSQMIYQLSHDYEPFWMNDKSKFKNDYHFSKTLKKIQEEIKRSDEDFIQDFDKNYSNDMPPCWMTMEIVSFGTLSMLFKNLKSGSTKRKIAKHFGLSDRVFESWIHTLVYLRNVCAHHSRLWNKDLRIQPTLPKSDDEVWLTDTTIRNDKVYFMLSMLLFLLKKVNPKTTFQTRILLLLTKYPNSDKKAMGFPENWLDEPLWKDIPDK